MNAQELWEAVKQEFAATVSAKTTNIYKTFIDRLEPIMIKNDKLFLIATNQIILEMIEREYLDILNGILEKKSNSSLSIQLILSLDDLNSEPKEEKKDIYQKNITLIPKYTFDSFVVGNNNVLAHSACVAVANDPAHSYNPLFIYGGVGLGKTHLMHAIGNHVLSQNKDVKILYLSSETFTNELINSIKDDTNEEFRNKYRKDVDILLIDDIQFISEKERTQEEFFHTFNTLHGADKQIIISSDRAPKEIPMLADRLRSRFEMGLIVDIQPPDYETRIAILRKKAQEEKHHVPDLVFEYIAKNIKSNIRELEGALTRIFAYSDLTKREITPELSQEALKNIFQSKQHVEITPTFIKEKVAESFSIQVDDFSSKGRKREIAYPRQIAMYLCRELTGLSLPKIGTEFGGRDHTTVMHACDKITSDIKIDEKTKELIENLKKDIQNA